MTWLLLATLGLLAGVWGAALLLGWPLALPLGVSVVLLVIVALAFTLRLLRARRRPAQLEAQLRRQDPSSEHVGGAHADALLEQQTRLRELAAALRRSQGANRWRTVGIK